MARRGEPGYGYIGRGTSTNVPPPQGGSALRPELPTGTGGGNDGQMDRDDAEWVNPPELESRLAAIEHEIRELKAQTALLSVRTATWVAQLAARLTNLEILLNMRQNVQQTREGLRFDGGMSPDAFDRIAQMVKEEFVGNG